MTELDLYKFIKNNNIERHKYEGNIIGFIDFGLLEEFCKMVGPLEFDEGGYEVHLKKDYIALSFNTMCENHGIEMDNVFNSDTQYH